MNRQRSPALCHFRSSFVVATILWNQNPNIYLTGRIGEKGGTISKNTSGMKRWKDGLDMLDEVGLR